VLWREFEFTDCEWVLHVRLANFEESRKRKSLDALAAMEVTSALLLIIAADAERLMRRAREISTSLEVLIKVYESNEKDLENYSHRIFDELRERIIRIEPVGSSCMCNVLWKPN
jgi:hypothetical protein